jgi:hypothetical protein
VHHRRTGRPGHDGDVLQMWLAARVCVVVVVIVVKVVVVMVIVVMVIVIDAMSVPMTVVRGLADRPDLDLDSVQGGRHGDDEGADVAADVEQYRPLAGRRVVRFHPNSPTLSVRW